MTAFEFKTQVIGLSDFVDRFALQYARNKEDARDLAQETMLRALTNYDKFRSNTNLKGWLRILMRNIFINGYRRSSSRVITYDSDSFFVQQGETDHYHALNQLGFKELDLAINKLPIDIQKPFKMHMAGYKYQEIADAMKLPIGTVKSRIFQARKVLAEKFYDAEN